MYSSYTTMIISITDIMVSINDTTINSISTISTINTISIIDSTIGVNNTTSNSIDISEKGGEKLINLKFW